MLQALSGARNDGVIGAFHQLVALGTLTQALVAGEFSRDFYHNLGGKYFYSRSSRSSW